MKTSNYQEVKNYIHNELGITKEDIQGIIRQTVREEVQQLIKSDYINNIVCYLIKKEMGNGLGNSFRANVRGIISNEIGKLIASKIKVDVELNEDFNEEVNRINVIDKN